MPTGERLEAKGKMGEVQAFLELLSPGLPSYLVLLASYLQETCTILLKESLIRDTVSSSVKFSGLNVAPVILSYSSI